MFLRTIVLVALIVLATLEVAYAGEFYLRGGFVVGEDDNTTELATYGHVSTGYRFTNGIFLEVAHDSDVQEKDTGYNRVLVGGEWSW